MIKVTLKGIFGTISEHYFNSLDDAYKWLDCLPYDESDVIGYTIETEVEE